MCSVARFYARHPKRGFSPLSARTYYGVRGVSKAGRTSEMYLGSTNYQHNNIIILGVYASFDVVLTLRTPSTAKPYSRWRKVGPVDLPL